MFIYRPKDDKNKDMSMYRQMETEDVIYIDTGKRQYACLYMYIWARGQRQYKQVYIDEKTSTICRCLYMDKRIAINS